MPARWRSFSLSTSAFRGFTVVGGPDNIPKLVLPHESDTSFDDGFYNNNYYLQYD